MMVLARFMAKIFWVVSNSLPDLSLCLVKGPSDDFYSRGAVGLEGAMR